MDPIELRKLIATRTVNDPHTEKGDRTEEALSCLDRTLSDMRAAETAVTDMRKVLCLSELEKSKGIPPAIPVLLLAIAVIFSAVAGGLVANQYRKSEAVRHGAAVWQVKDDYGGVRFVWKDELETVDLTEVGRSKNAE